MKIFILCEQIRRGYGVDRVAIEMARSFQSKKYDVVLIVTEFSGDSKLSDEFRILEIGSTFGFDTWSADKRSSEAASKIVDFLSEDSSNLVISQGWPFISYPRYSSQGKPGKLVFVDHGCEPVNGENFEVQKLLKKLRMRFLDQYDLLVPISNFIKRTQTDKDAPNAAKEIIGWSGDHMKPFIKPVERKKQIFFLGRYEYGYKSAQEFEKFIHDLRKVDPQIEGVYSARKAVSRVTGIRHLGWLDDEAMAVAMQESICCISFSKWEGFNLPILESERLLVPTFSYAGGASVETISRKDRLFYDASEVFDKFQELLKFTDENPESKKTYDNFRTWDNVTEDFIKSLESIPEIDFNQKPTLLLLDLTNAQRDNANSGVVHTSRSLAKHLSKLTEANVLPIIWDGDCFQIPRDWGFIGHFNGPQPSDFPLYDFLKGKSLKEFVLEEGISKSHKIKFLQIEIPLGQNYFARFKELATYSSEMIVYIHDLIAIHNPEIVSEEIVLDFEGYLEICEKSDLILTSTEFNKKQIVEYFEGDVKVEVVGLGTEITTGNEKLNLNPKIQANGKFVLMISTLEPRKGHKFIIESLELFNSSRNEEDQINLFLVGNKYAGDKDLFPFIQKQMSKSKWLKYLGVLSKDDLDSLVQNCELMIYGSSIEGFGLPILESLVNGKRVLFPFSDCYSHFDGLEGAIAFQKNNTPDFLEKLQSNLSNNSNPNPNQVVHQLPERFYWPYVSSQVLDKMEIGEMQMSLNNRQSEPKVIWEHWPLSQNHKMFDRRKLLSSIDHVAIAIHRSYLNGFMRRLLNYLPRSFNRRLYLALSRGYRKIKAMI